jgi:hypothetical protein
MHSLFHTLGIPVSGVLAHPVLFTEINEFAKYFEDAKAAVEFYNPRAAAEFLEMPGRISRLEHDIKEVSDFVKQQRRQRMKAAN